MNLTGEQLAARFSCRCWTSRIKGFSQLLEEFAIHGTNYRQAIEILKRLMSFGWYRIIAEKNNIDNPFDIRIVRAYWLGDNNLTTRIESEGNILSLFHNFTVLGDIHRYRGIKIEDIDRCKVSIAKVLNTEESRISVHHQALIREDSKFFLAEDPKPIFIEKGFAKEAKTGDWVVYHEGIAIQVLSEDEASAFIRQTKEAVALFNKQQN